MLYCGFVPEHGPPYFHEIQLSLAILSSLIDNVVNGFNIYNPLQLDDSEAIIFLSKVA
jgi:hypothetical protein